MAAAVAEGPSVPLVSHNFPEWAQAGSQNNLEEGSTRLLRSLFPDRARTILLADRGFGRGERARTLGTDVTKEVSAKVLTDANFASILNAVEEGRGVYDNIQTFLHYLSPGTSASSCSSSLPRFSAGRSR